jgi:hypothetical protein
MNPFLNVDVEEVVGCAYLQSVFTDPRMQIYAKYHRCNGGIRCDQGLDVPDGCQGEI